MDRVGLVLSQIPLLASLPDEKFEKLISSLQMIEIEDGAIVFEQADEDEHFYIISSGQVQVVILPGTTEEQLVGVWETGEFISNVRLMNIEGKLTAFARAVGQVILLELPRSELEGLLIRQPGLAYDTLKKWILQLNTTRDKVIFDLQEKNNQLIAAYDALKAVQGQIIEKEKMEHELKVANKIQISILPHKLPQVEGFDFGALVVPMRGIGGDFYDFISLGDNKLGIAIGDVSGHGVPAALFMALTVTLLRAEACRSCSPVEVLSSVNSQLMRINDEGMYVTILYGVLDTLTGDFNFVRAGHELPFLFTNQGKMIEVCLEPGQPLGLFNAPLLSDQLVQIQDGATLLFYTDGVTESVSVEDEMFGPERLKKAVRKFQHQSAQVICERVMDLVTIHRGEAAQSDDVTVVCMRSKLKDELGG